MYYEINVAKKEKRQNGNESYCHFFATASRSITQSKKLKEVLSDFLVKFPQPEYKIRISFHPESGYDTIITGNETNEEFDDLINNITRFD